MAEITFDEELGIIKTSEPNYEIDPDGVGHAFFSAMKKHSDRTAQIHAESGSEETYGHLLLRCIRCATEMRKSGIEPGDIISICSRNTMDNIVPFYAAHFLGAIVASLDPALSLDDSIHLLKQAEPKLIFTDAESEALIESAIRASEVNCEIIVIGPESGEKRTLQGHFNDESVDENDFVPFAATDLQATAVILFSSGTTGLAKGICISHTGLLYQASVLFNNGHAMDRNLSYATTYWISTVLLTAVNPMFGKCRCVVEGKFDPNELWVIIERLQLTLSFLAPVHVAILLRNGRPDGVNTSSLGDVMIGGGSLTVANNIALRDILPGTHVSVTYGQSEAAGALTLFRADQTEDILAAYHKPGSSGKPLPGFQYKVVDVETGEVVGLNERGEMRYHSKAIMTGYYNLDSADAFDENGWIRSGDVVYFDEEFCIYVVDRIKEMLKFQGFHVLPAKLESLLNCHPDVASAVVIGIPDDDDGDHPMGLVILRPGATVTENDLVEYVGERVDDRSRLRAGIRFLDSFPYTPSGKVKKTVLRKMIMAGEL